MLIKIMVLLTALNLLERGSKSFPYGLQSRSTFVERLFYWVSLTNLGC
jgi:hypothetical protein